MTVGLTAATTIAGRRIARTGRLRRLPVLGASVMAAALAGLALAAPAASPGSWSPGWSCSAPASA